MTATQRDNDRESLLTIHGMHDIQSQPSKKKKHRQQEQQWTERTAKAAVNRFIASIWKYLNLHPASTRKEINLKRGRRIKELL